MTTTTNESTEHELASLKTWREFSELSQQVSRIPREEYLAWVESPEGMQAMVDLIAGTIGGALQELEKH